MSISYEESELSELEGLVGGPTGLQQGPARLRLGPSGVGLEDPPPLQFHDSLRAPFTPDEFFAALWSPAEIRRLRRLAAWRTRPTKGKKASRTISRKNPP